MAEGERAFQAVDVTEFSEMKGEWTSLSEVADREWCRYGKLCYARGCGKLHVAVTKDGVFGEHEGKVFLMPTEQYSPLPDLLEMKRSGELALKDADAELSYLSRLLMHKQQQREMLIAGLQYTDRRITAAHQFFVV
jgi:hypothetical protein